MEELSIKLLYGTEIFLKYYSVFIQLLNKGIYNKINCSIGKETLMSLRGEYGEEFYKSYYDLLKFILNDGRINVVDNQDFEEIDVTQLSKKYNLNVEYNIRRDLIEEMNLDIPEKYITLSTKSLNSISLRQWNEIKQIFFAILNSCEYPVIILGEREVTSCKEYDIHGAYSLYKDIIENLHYYIDMTISDSTRNNDVEPLKQTFYLLNKSKLNIYITDSGIKTIALCCSQNILGLTTTVYDKNLFKHEDISNIHQVNEINEFINSLYFIIKKI